MGSWRDPHPHFHLHLISCRLILSPHTTSRTLTDHRFRMPFPCSDILGTKLSSHKCDDATRHCTFVIIIITNFIMFHHCLAKSNREYVSVCTCGLGVGACGAERCGRQDGIAKRKNKTPQGCGDSNKQLQNTNSEYERSEKQQTTVSGPGLVWHSCTVVTMARRRLRGARVFQRAHARFRWVYRRSGAKAQAGEPESVSKSKGRDEN